MSWDPLLPAIFGLIGTAVGAAGSVLTILVQSRHQRRSEQLRMAVEVALAERASAIELVKNNGGGYVYPMVMHLSHSIEVLRILEDRTITADDLREISKRTGELVVAAQEATDAAHQRRDGSPRK